MYTTFCILDCLHINEKWCSNLELKPANFFEDLCEMSHPKFGKFQVFEEPGTHLVVFEIKPTRGPYLTLYRCQETWLVSLSLP